MKRVIDVQDEAQVALAGNHCERMIVEYPIKADGDPIEWWRKKAEEDGWTHDEIGKEMGYDGSVISKVFAGKYTGDTRKVWDSAADARDMVMGPGQGAFVNTVTAQLIAEALNDARGSEFMTVLVGDPGCGKTSALNRFVNITDRGKALLITIDQTASVNSLIAEIGEELKVDLTGQTAIRVKRIAEELRRRRKLLIFDEVNNLAFNAARATRILNTIRQINDLSHCGVVLCGTHNLFHMIFGKNRDQMEMIRSRVGTEMTLPTADKQEVEALLTAHFGDVSNKAWKAFEDGMNGEKRLMGISSGYSLRRAAAIIRQVHLLMKKNQRVGQVRLSPALVNEALKHVRQK